MDLIAYFLFAFAKTNPNLRLRFMPRYRNLWLKRAFTVCEATNIQHATLEALIQKTKAIRGVLAERDALSETTLKKRKQTTAKTTQPIKRSTEQALIAKQTFKNS